MSTIVVLLVGVLFAGNTVYDAGRLYGHPGLARRQFWPELLAANPGALVVLSVRDPDTWYRSASLTVFDIFG